VAAAATVKMNASKKPLRMISLKQLSMHI